MTPTQRAEAKAALDAWAADLERGMQVFIPAASLRKITASLAEPAVEPACKSPLRVYRPTGWVAHKNQYAVPVLFNPYTGEPRDVRDVQSDPQGILIVPPGKVEMLAATAAEPAVEPVAPPTDEALREVFAQCLTSTYVCGRVWSAWGVSTMSEDDFSPASECDELLDSLIQAVRQKAGW